ncbi:MAG: GGDEF domain-containing protein [Planctomycetaceae bacterium]|nr:GGDEF domain-containing protein [Planctomycetales bacterium]MCB9924101.1 GGDEF domain-containing protein [Planctomycetaceae bacterium]
MRSEHVFACHFVGIHSVLMIVFALAVANLGLGFALAVALDRFPILSFTGIRRNANGGANSSASALPGSLEELSTEPADKWSQMLLAAEVDAKSQTEQLLWIIKLDTASRRERLIELDRALLKNSPAPEIAEAFEQDIESFSEQVDRWIIEVEPEKEQAGAIGNALEELLLDLAVQLRSCPESDEAEGGTGVARRLEAAIHLLNALRDRTDALLCRLLTKEDRLHSVADRHRTFGEKGTFTHLGLAALFDEWWHDDPDHVRLVSVVVLDLDAFSLYSSQVGAFYADKSLNRLGDLLHSLLRKDRGFDRVARYSGQRFLLFMGDTSSKNAAKGAERVRQSIEAASFKLGNESYRITCSVGVVEVGKDEGPDQFLLRAEAAVNAAKDAGRNRGFVDAADGPVAIRLPSFGVADQCIELDDDPAT